MGKYEDLSNRRYGRLLVKQRSMVEDRKVYYDCICDCGNDSLRMGFTKSCGCLQKEKASIVNSKAPGISNFNSIFRNYKRHAKTRNLDFSLNENEFYKLTQEPCYYCGVSFSNKSKPSNSKHNFLYNGIDRVDNTKGYTVDNVVSCCSVCNGAKSKRSKEEFLEWVLKITKHLRLN